MCTYIWIFNFVYLIYMSVLVHALLLWYYIMFLNSGIGNPWDTVLFAKGSLAIWCSPCFYMNFRIKIIFLAISGNICTSTLIFRVLFIFVKNGTGICIGIEPNPYIAFGIMVIYTLLILPVHEHGRSLF